MLEYLAARNRVFSYRRRSDTRTDTRRCAQTALAPNAGHIYLLTGRYIRWLVVQWGLPLGHIGR